MAGMKISDHYKIRGRLLIEVYRDKKLIHQDLGDNVVTNNGKNHILRLMAGLDDPIAMSPATPISRMEVGDGGCGAPFPATSLLFTPIAFVATDNTLRNSIQKVVTVEADPTVDTGVRTLTFVGIIPSSGIPNGNYHGTPRVINEIALKSGTTDNITVALRSFKSIPFDPADSIEVRATWTLGLL